LPGLINEGFIMVLLKMPIFIEIYFNYIKFSAFSGTF